MLPVQVDDGFHVDNDTELWEEVKAHLTTQNLKFTVHEQMTEVLGVRFTRNRTNRTMEADQIEYLRRALEKYKLRDIPIRRTLTDDIFGTH